MTPINKLSGIDAIALGDLLAIFSQSEGDARKVSLTQLRALIAADVGALLTQYAAPSATGFSVTVAQADTRLILTPAAGYANGAIVLPTATDGQKIVVSCTQSVAALAISGGTVHGAPTALSANGYFTLQYDAVMSVWIRIG
jgi:hypothetical protein